MVHVNDLGIDVPFMSIYIISHQEYTQTGSPIRNHVVYFYDYSDCKFYFSRIELNINECRVFRVEVVRRITDVLKVKVEYRQDLIPRPLSARTDMTQRVNQELESHMTTCKRDKLINGILDNSSLL